MELLKIGNEALGSRSFGRKLARSNSAQTAAAVTAVAGQPWRL